MLVADIMSHHIERVKSSDSIRSAARLMLEYDIGALLVEDARGEISGIVTDRDITTRAVADGRGHDTPVEACMTREPVSCRIRDDLWDAVEIMKREKVRRLLVRDMDDRPVGVVAQADIAMGIAPYGPAAEMVETVSEPGGEHSQH